MKILSILTPNQFRFQLASSCAFGLLIFILQPSSASSKAFWLYAGLLLLHIWFLLWSWLSIRFRFLTFHWGFRCPLPSFVSSIVIFMTYITSSKTSFRKTLKYWGNKTNHIFTIDNTNVLKKNVHNYKLVI